MRKMIDEQLRELFREKASGFVMDPAMPTGVVRRARRRVATGLIGAASVLTAAVVFSTLGSGMVGRPEGGDSRTATVRLVAYVKRGRALRG